jgi:hypothetical protein
MSYCRDFSLIPELTTTEKNVWSEKPNSGGQLLWRFYQNIFPPSQGDSIAFLNNFTYGIQILPLCLWHRFWREHYTCHQLGRWIGSSINIMLGWQYSRSVRWWPRILFKRKIGSVGATTLLERGSIKILGTGLLGGAFGWRIRGSSAVDGSGRSGMELGKPLWMWIRRLTDCRDFLYIDSREI